MRIAARRLLCLHPKGKTTQRTKLMTIQYPVVNKYIVSLAAVSETDSGYNWLPSLRSWRGATMRSHHAK